MTYAEKAYLHQVARRSRQLEEKARQNGESWVRTNRRLPLESGPHVDLRYTDKKMVLEVFPNGLDTARLPDLASELLGAPVSSGTELEHGLYLFELEIP